MDPNAALYEIEEGARITANTREAMGNLYNWLRNGGFPPNWAMYPKGTKRFRKAYGTWKGMPGTFGA